MYCCKSQNRLGQRSVTAHTHACCSRHGRSVRSQEKRKQQEEADRAAAAEAAAAAAVAFTSVTPTPEDAPIDLSGTPGPSTAPGRFSGTQPTSQQQQQGEGGSSGPAAALPVNPFFTKRRPAGQKQGSGAAGAADGGSGESAGTAGAAGALGAKRAPLGEMMPPIHVRQLEGAQVCAAGPGVGGVDTALWRLLRARTCEQAPVAARSAGAEAAGAGSQTEAEATGPNGSVADAAMVRLQEAIAAEQSRSSAAAEPHVAGCSFWPCWPTGRAAAAAAAAATEAARPAAGMPGVGVEEAAGRAGLPVLAEGGATGDSSLLRQLASRLAAEAGATAGCSQDPAVSLH